MSQIALTHFRRVMSPPTFTPRSPPPPRHDTTFTAPAGPPTILEYILRGQQPAGPIVLVDQSPSRRRGSGLFYTSHSSEAPRPRRFALCRVEAKVSFRCWASVSQPRSTSSLFPPSGRKARRSSYFLFFFVLILSPPTAVIYK